MDNTNKKDLKILNWNANGLNVNKVNDIKQLLKQKDLDILIISETHLTNAKKPHPIKGYKISHFNRVTAIRGGGVAIYHKSTLGAVEIEIDRNTFISELVGIKLIDGTSIFGLYAPTNNLLIDEIEHFLNIDKVIIAGDFNARHTDWHNRVNNRNGTVLHNLLSENPYILYFPEHNTFISRQGVSTIDLAISNNVPITHIEAIQDLCSDHCPIIYHTKSYKSETNNHRVIKDFDHANWKDYGKYLRDNWTMTQNFNNNNEIETTTQQITEHIRTASDLFIPNKRFNNEYPNNIKIAIKLRNALRRKFQRNRTWENEENLQYQNNIVGTLLKSYNQHFWEKRIAKANADKANVWKEIKNKKRGEGFNIPILKLNNNLYITDLEKAEILSQKMCPETLEHNIINNNDRETLNISNTYENLPLRNQPQNTNITPGKIRNIVRYMRPYKAPGEDGIQPKHLKMAPKKIIVQLYYIYKACLKFSYFPEIWKNAKIVPIHKPGKIPSSPEAYRPISLLPLLGKIFEKIINRELTEFLDTNNILIEEQYGFRKGRSTLQQAARVVHKAKINFNKKLTTSVLFLDLEKAFDTVWHDGMIHKLHDYAFPPYLIKLIKSYLKNRRIQVAINNIRSSEKIQTRGVPQGGCLSTTLFIIYMNDIPKNDGTDLAVFADDTAIMADSKSIKIAHRKLQAHFIKITDYFEKWKTKLNVNKTKLINFNKKKKTDNENTGIVKYNNQIIETVDEIKYLGIILDKRLIFKKHIDNATRKSHAILKYLYPYINKFSKLDTKLKINLYRAYVKPTLLYGSPIWSSTSNTQLKRLQIIENKFLRIILNKRRDQISNQDLYAELNIIPILHKMLDIWRKFFNYDIITTPLTENLNYENPGTFPYKIKHNLINSRIYENDDTV